MSENYIYMMTDLELNVVGCVNIQAAYGCSSSRDFVMQLPVELWSTTVTAKMKKYILTKEQAQQYVDRLLASRIPA